jgi:hypothetical protein
MPLPLGTMQMKTYIIYIVILVFEIIGILALNKFISKRNGMILVLFISLLLFILGLWLKHIDSQINYRLLLVPFIQSGLLSVLHIVYQLTFKIPFYLPLRGFEYPFPLKTKGNNLVDYLSGLLSACIVMITILLYFLL